VTPNKDSHPFADCVINLALNLFDGSAVELTHVTARFCK
jgi:hypothetical protein